MYSLYLGKYDTPMFTSQEGDTALLMACRYGHFNIAKLLIHNGADINHQNNVRL